MKLRVQNFRSITDQEIDLAPITLIYGPNGSGKSSLLYAPLTMKNAVLNSNQNVNGFFNYGFIALGSYESVIFDHRTKAGLQIEFALQGESESFLTPPGVAVSWIMSLGIGQSAGSYALGVDFGHEELNTTLNLPVSFPYPGNLSAKQPITLGGLPMDVLWNGVTAQIQVPTTDEEIVRQANEMVECLNVPAETLRGVSIIPVKRGLSKPHYSSVAMTPGLISEDEVATLLSTNKTLEARVSFYLEKILDRDFRVHVQPGTAIFSLDSTDRKTGVPSELVNDGFGVNQVVYILARCLHDDANLICLEEPEIHLHPSAVRRLAQTIVQLFHDERKQFIISTHSEHLVTAFLSAVTRGELGASELACYLCEKEKKSTRIARQAVNDDGQISGGLTSFIKGEVEELMASLGIKE